MPKPLMSDEEWFNFLKECRSSGMSDKDLLVSWNGSAETCLERKLKLPKDLMTIVILACIR